MSRILSKAFDASKKIIRSVFLGSPNLLTTSDLNRQFEAIKFQMDKNDEKTGFISDIKVTHSLTSGTLNVSYDYSYLEFKGCKFSPAKVSLNTNLTSGAPKAYLCLTATKETLTYDTDSSHDIAGAKFADGTSQAAANQMVYKGEQLVLSHALSSVSNFVGVVAVIELTESGNVVVKVNALKDKESLSLRDEDLVTALPKNVTGPVTIGDTYNTAFSKLNAAFNRASKAFYLTAAASSGASLEFTISGALSHISEGDMIEFFVNLSAAGYEQCIQFGIVYTNDNTSRIKYAPILMNPDIYGGKSIFPTPYFYGKTDNDLKVTLSFAGADFAASTLPGSFCVIHKLGGVFPE